MRDWQVVGSSAVSLRERVWLRDTAREVARRVKRPTIVHLGVDYGSSLYCTLEGAPEARTIGVDLDVSKYQGAGEMIEGDSADVWRNVTGPVHLLFVDADHTRDSVRRDMDGWLGKVAPGGYVAFHDYHRDYDVHPWTAGVKQAVDEHHWAPTAWNLAANVDSIRAYWRRPFLRAGETFGTLGIGVPYYKAQYEFFRWWTWLIAGGLEVGDGLLNTPSLRCEVPIPMAHNGLVLEFLRTDKDTLCIVEDDHLGDQEVVRQMRTKAENLDFDIVCASYASRRLPLTANGYNFVANDPNEYGEYTMLLEPMKVAETGTQEYDGATLGLVLIRRWVLEKMLGEQDPEEFFWFDWRGRNSQDVVFYQRVKELTGARVGVDRDARIGHVGKAIYTMEQYYEQKNRFLKKQEATNNG